MSALIQAFHSELFSLLDGDATLGGLITGIYQQVPDDTDYPFIRMAQQRSSDWSAQALEGEELLLMLEVYSRYAGWKQANDIMARIHVLLHANDLSNSTMHVAHLRIQQRSDELLADGRTMRAQMQLRALIHSKQ